MGQIDHLVSVVAVQLKNISRKDYKKFLRELNQAMTRTVLLRELVDAGVVVEALLEGQSIKLQSGATSLLFERLDYQKGTVIYRDPLSPEPSKAKPSFFSKLPTQENNCGELKAKVAETRPKPPAEIDIHAALDKYGKV